MADIEAYPPKSWAPHVRVRGALTAKDLPLLKRFTVPDRGLVVDIRGVRVLTDGGCETLRRLGRHLSGGGRRLTVLHPADGPVADKLDMSGLFDDWRIHWTG